MFTFFFVTLSWPHLQVHSGCMDNVKLECTYRDLYHMILLPKALTYRPSLNSDPAANTPGTPAGGG